jgi:PhzF family phenazine biosynthesis protein
MKIPIYQVDAFTNKVFSGNPAAVCPLECWLPDHMLQAIASENNLSETAFFVKKDDNSYDLRWFTPKNEVDLCGHATLASSYVIFKFLNPQVDKITFQSASGPLTVRKIDDDIELNFPALSLEPCSPPLNLIESLKIRPLEVYQSKDYLVVLENEHQVKEVHPDFNLLTHVKSRGVIITAPGTQSDFVSRFFAPQVGVPEDPVTGSAHCALVPYWAKRLRKNKLYAKQLSKREGEIVCTLQNDRVLLQGKAVEYLAGSITIPKV